MTETYGRLRLVCIYIACHRPKRISLNRGVVPRQAAKQWQQFLIQQQQQNYQTKKKLLVKGKEEEAKFKVAGCIEGWSRINASQK